MNNYFVKAPQSYEKSYEYAKEVLWIPTLSRIFWMAHIRFSSQIDNLRIENFLETNQVSTMSRDLCHKISWNLIKRSK